MNKNISDDPRQVLAILNSLGVVGVTAAELKAFMKELKLYRKIREQETQKWKEETKARILKKHQQLESLKANFHKENVTHNFTVHKQERRRSRSERRNCVEVIIDRKTQHKLNHNKENDVEETISTLAVSFEKCQTHTPCNKTENTFRKQVEKSNERPKSAPQCDKVENRPSRKRTKSITSIDSRKTRSKSTQSRSRSKSYIRSPESRPESRSSVLNKRGASDPVALYNKYKSIWDQLSLPGEESHAKLRWSVREKMLGSEPVPKPVVQYKKPLQTLSSKGKRK